MLDIESSWVKNFGCKIFSGYKKAYRMYKKPYYFVTYYFLVIYQYMYIIINDSYIAADIFVPLINVQIWQCPRLYKKLFPL